MTRRRPTGRPPLPTDQRKSTAVLVRLTPQEKRDLERLAQAAGRPVAAYVRERALA